MVGFSGMFLSLQRVSTSNSLLKHDRLTKERISENFGSNIVVPKNMVGSMISQCIPVREVEAQAIVSA